MDKASGTTDPTYRLDDQVGFLLRRASQRHLAIFGSQIPELTSTQFAALAKLCELGPISQNALGRATAMDAATIKGVTDRLRAKGLVASTRDAGDRRRIRVAPTEAGRTLFAALTEAARQITTETLEPLSQAERKTFLAFLARLT
jgi:DNA-binding MarR family transcriptional regulator